jgi:hypothetical protein
MQEDLNILVNHTKKHVAEGSVCDLEADVLLLSCNGCLP